VSLGQILLHLLVRVCGTQHERDRCPFRAVMSLNRGTPSAVAIMAWFLPSPFMSGLVSTLRWKPLDCLRLPGNRVPVL
jgi:hypothetical protein